MVHRPQGWSTVDWVHQGTSALMFTWTESTASLTDGRAVCRFWRMVDRRVLAHVQPHGSSWTRCRGIFFLPFPFFLLFCSRLRCSAGGEVVRLRLSMAPQAKLTVPTSLLGPGMVIGSLGRLGGVLARPAHAAGRRSSTAERRCDGYSSRNFIHQT